VDRPGERKGPFFPEGKGGFCSYLERKEGISDWGEKKGGERRSRRRGDEEKKR